MNRFITSAMAIAVILTSSFFAPTDTKAAAADIQKGATFFGKAPDDFSSARFKQSVDDLVAIGATDAALLYHIYQTNETSSDLHAGWNTPTDQALTDGINYLHSKGLRVMVVVKADTENGTWHANIEPANRDQWFQSYGQWVNKIATIGQSRGLEQLSIGTELYKVASEVHNPNNTVRWNSIITSVRSLYTGKLVYGSQHTGDRSELLELGFGGSLDYVGISAYFPLTAPGSTPEAILHNSWLEHQVRIEAAQQRYNKPVIFTEAGYRSVVDSHVDPYSFWRVAPVDLVEQSRNYNGLFTFWTPKTYFKGIYIWAWETDPNAGGPLDSTYTPQNKPAEQVLCKWYKHNGTQDCANTGTGTGTGTGTTSTTTTGGGTNTGTAGNTQFTITGSMPQQAVINTNVSTNLDITTSSNIEDIIVQAEIFDSNWKQVARKAFALQDFVGGVKTPFNFTWVPKVVGDYSLKVGLYNAAWSNIGYYSLDSVKTKAIEEISGGQNPSPQTGAITIWWPTTTAVRGNQPVRALLNNAPLNTYTMSFSIDGGTEVAMTDGTTPSAHKQGVAEFWRLSAGAHTLTIVAKNSSGTTIASQSQTVTVVK